MIWGLLALVGAGSFLVSGFSVLTDSTCQSVDFGGGRVIQLTCRGDEFGAFSSTAAGWLSITGGLILLSIIFRKPLKLLFNGIWNPKPVNSSSTFFDPTISAPDVERIEETVNVSIDSPRSSTSVEDELKKCPKCAELIKVEAVKCRHCGSSLLPSVEDKIKAIWSQGNFKWGISITLVAVVALAWVGINNANLAKEKQLLNESGQVCVFFADRDIELGCADYPKVEFDFCSAAVSAELDYANSEYESIFEFEGTQAERINGIKSYACTNEEVPFFYDISTTTNRLLGEYEIDQWRYTVPSGQGGKLESGTTFTMKISQK